MSAPRPTLLVADDYPENCKLFSIYLRKDYEVVTALSAEAALARIQEGGIAAALLDINYQGGMSGLDLVRHLRADPALAAHASPENRRACLEAGFHAYLSRPVLKAQMLTAVEALLMEATTPGSSG